MSENENYDVVVVGGGAAGLNGALALARSRRSVLVVDAGDPRNTPAGHVHNFLSRDGTPPSELYAAGRAEVRRYGGRVEAGRVTALARDGERFGVRIGAETGERTVAARRLLVATGVRDVLPDVPGWPPGGALTCCTARTATAGRSGTSASASCRPARPPCTRPCCSSSSART